MQAIQLPAYFVQLFHCLHGPYHLIVLEDDGSLSISLNSKDQPLIHPPERIIRSKRSQVLGCVNKLDISQGRKNLYKKIWCQEGEDGQGMIGNYTIPGWVADICKCSTNLRTGITIEDDTIRSWGVNTPAPEALRNQRFGNCTASQLIYCQLLKKANELQKRGIDLDVDQIATTWGLRSPHNLKVVSMEVFKQNVQNFPQSEAEALELLKAFKFYDGGDLTRFRGSLIKGALLGRLVAILGEEPHIEDRRAWNGYVYGYESFAKHADTPFMYLRSGAPREWPIVEVNGQSYVIKFVMSHGCDDNAVNVDDRDMKVILVEPRADGRIQDCWGHILDGLNRLENDLPEYNPEEDEMTEEIKRLYPLWVERCRSGY